MVFQRHRTNFIFLRFVPNLQTVVKTNTCLICGSLSNVFEISQNELIFSFRGFFLRIKLLFKRIEFVTFEFWKLELFESNYWSSNFRDSNYFESNLQSFCWLELFRFEFLTVRITSNRNLKHQICSNRIFTARISSNYFQWNIKHLIFPKVVKMFLKTHVFASFLSSF